jgi:hypothetical protein
MEDVKMEIASGAAKVYQLDAEGGEGIPGRRESEMNYLMLEQINPQFFH